MDDLWYGNDPTVLPPREPQAGVAQPAPAGAEWWPDRWTRGAAAPDAAPAVAALRTGPRIAPGRAAGRDPGAVVGDIPTLRPREPALSLLLSSVVPGAATVLNGETLRGTWTVLLFAVAVAVSLVHPAVVPVAAGVWAWGAVDGYRSAVRWNRRHQHPG